MRIVSALRLGIFLLLAFVFAGGALFYAARGKDTARPNIVLMMVDTLRADRVGAYGFSPSPSLELDTLGFQGTVFEKVIAQSSWTRSSVASLLTSEYPRTLGLLKEKWDRLPDGAETLPEILQKNGYRTMGFTANPQINKTFNFHQGFDHYVESDVIFTWMKEEEGKAKATRERRVMRAPDLFQAALDAVDRDDGDKPFYLQFLIMEVHGHERVPADRIDPAFAGHRDAAYLQTVSDASKAIGEFIAELSKRREFRNTLFIITADHGEGLADHPNVAKSDGHGNLLYESNVWVPLIFFSTGDERFAEKRVQHDARLLDVTPTVLDYLGLPLPPAAVGTSFMSVIDNPSLPSPIPDHIITETQWREVNKIAVYSDRWVYIENRDGWPGVNERELQPRGERQNGRETDKILAEREVGNRMQRLLEAWERQFSVRRQAPGGAEPSASEIEQLKSIGYL